MHRVELEAYPVQPTYNLGTLTLVGKFAHRVLNSYMITARLSVSVRAAVGSAARRGSSSGSRHAASQRVPGPAILRRVAVRHAGTPIR